MEDAILVGRSDRHPQAVGESGPARAIANEHATIEESLPDGTSTRRARPEQHEIGTTRKDVDGKVGQGGHESVAFGDDSFDSSVHLVEELVKTLLVLQWVKRKNTLIE